MKFLCPSCKAKYQIADEKIAGRSVRMKCRKCGFVIPLSEIPPAPETMPPEDAGWDMSPPAVPKAPAAPAMPDATSPVAAPPPSAASTPAVTAATPSAPKAAPAPASRAAPVPKPAPKPPSAGAPSVAAKPGAMRPTLGGAAVPRAPQASPAASKAPVPKAPAAAAAKPAPAAAAVKPVASPAPAVTAAPKVEPGAPKVEHPGAPAPAAASPGAAAVLPATPPPPSVVPVSAVELMPAVGGDDEDDDATRIVKGGALADAFGALVVGPPSGPPPGDIGMPGDEWFVGINDVPVGPIRLGEIRKRALLGAVTLESMVWRDGLEAWRPLKTFPELVAVLEESMSSVRASSAPMLRPAAGAPALGKAGEPDSLAGASSGITGSAVVTDDYAIAGMNQGRSPIFAWLAIFVALGCGFTIAYVVFSKQRPPETIVKYVEVPAKTEATPAAVAIQDPQAPAAGPAPSGAAPKAHGSKSSGVAKAPDATPASTGGGLSGLKGLSALGPSGPAVGNASPGAAPAAGGGQLDGAQTQATVARYTGSVKRSCWQPALDARAPDAPTSARVTVTITVGGNGNVQNVTTSGDPRGYPGLATCIGGRVRAWQFPATGGTTTVNVPFVFAAQ